MSDKQFIEGINEWYREILENISDLDYINLYKNSKKIDIDFSYIDNFWYRHTSYIEIDLIKENINQLKYKIDLIYNDSIKKTCYVDFDKVDIDFSIFYKKINNNIFNLLLDIYKDSID